MILQRREMSQAYTGGCACGAIRYEISVEPIFQAECQCRDCQRMSGLCTPRVQTTRADFGHRWSCTP
jgi:hypothetical protein